MNNKVTIAVSTALLSMATLQASASTVPTQYSADLLKSVAPISINKGGSFNQQQAKKFRAEKDLDGGTYTYIVRLKDQPIATYDGSVAGLSATNPQIAKKSLFSSLAKSKKSSQEIRKELRLDLKAAEAVAYSNYLESKHQAFLSKASSKLGNNLDVSYKYKNAFNGMAVRLTQNEAKTLSKLADVAYVERERMEQMETDTGPIHIGAHDVWDGEGQAAVNMGEGVIIGVIDSGINSDHASFADIGGDGYDHTNPWGAGVYVGDCAGDFASMCNDKLIGVRSYASVTDNYDDTVVFGDNPPAKNGEDYGGHGSHTASTSGGNILLNVPLVDQEIDEETGDGINTTGFEFAQISGVAPHANIVAYQICNPGNSSSTGPSDTYNGCPSAAIIAALDDAVADGVDVLNYSISGGGNPWVSSIEQGFLAAQEAGIFAAVSAGNSGPEAQTTVKNAPWYTVVGASTHGREVAFDKEIGEFTGGDTDLATLEGKSASGGITGSIVWAGDYENPNDLVGDPEQCLEPFPAGTFDGEIVVCDRGAIARVQKAINVADGGAGGFVLGNVSAGTVNNDVYVVPGIHLNVENGDALRAWLATGTDHMATITAADGELVVTPEDADVMADFSSRGSNVTVPDVMTPSVTGPGVSIYAAYSDEQYGHDVLGTDPADYAFLQGTSMSAPHTSGAGAVLKSAHPTWTPDNIRSALMLTATRVNVRKDDGVTPADAFDMGSGSIRVNLAHQTGLIMNETAANYTAANPAEDGDPKTLNIPSVTNANCVGLCDWSRTVTATAAGTWTVEGVPTSDGLVITTTPATFTLAAGESQTLAISVDAIDAESDVWSFGHVVMTSPDFPTASIPVNVIASNGNVPDKVTFEASRNQDSYLIEDVMAVEITEFTARSYGLTKADQVEATLTVDSDNSDAYDDITDGNNVTLHTVPADAKRFVAEILASESPDLDLRVGLDANGDGIPQANEEVGISATGTALEKVELLMPEAGSYWVAVQNWAASSEGAADAYTLATAVVDGEMGDNLSVEADSAIAALTEFDLRFKWTLDGGMAGDVYYGAVDLGTNAERAGNLGLVSVDLTRGMDDVSITSNADAYMERQDTVDYQVTVLPKLTPGDRTYTVTATVPKGMTLDEDSVTGDAVINGKDITWTLAQESLYGIQPFYTKTTNADDASCGVPFGDGSYIDLAGFNIGPGAMNGDSQTGTYSLPANFLGTLYSSLTITDDGFIYFGGDAGATPWVNQLLPNEDAANNLVAPFWRDMQIAASETSGVSVASAGAGTTIVEFDDMRHYNFYNGSPEVADVLDFEVVFNNTTGDFAFAYDNVTHVAGADLGVTVGLENATGTAGRTDVYAPSPYGGEAGSVGDISDIYSGLVICYTLTEVEIVPTVFNFSAEIKDSFTGGPVAVVLTNSTDDVNTVEVVNSTSVVIQVEGAPTAVITGSTAATEGDDVALSASNSTDPNGDMLTYNWVQLSGTPVAFNASSESISFTAPKVSQDETIPFLLTVDDGNGNTATTIASVSIVNKKESGSFGWLMLLLTPMLFTRRKKA